MTDEELLHQMSRGNSAALETLVYRYHVPLQTYLIRVLGSKTLAEDLTQECFIRVMESVKSNRVPTSFRPWLYRIATNISKDIWKKSSFRHEVLDEKILFSHASNETVATIFQKQVERETINHALQQLEEDRRNIVFLRFYQDLKLEEIAEALDLPLSTVKTRLYQSLKKLGTIIKKEEEKERGGEARHG